MFEGLPIKTASLALLIGTKRTSHIRPFLPAKTEPPHVLGHRFAEIGFGTRRIQVLVSQDQSPVCVHTTLLCGPEGARMPEVKLPGGRGSRAAFVTFPRQSLILALNF